jgi:hypothetical protein
MLKNNYFKYFGKGNENRNWAVSIYQGDLSFLKNREIGRLLPVGWEKSL